MKIVHLTFFMVLALAIPLKSEGPQFQQKDTYVQQEFDNAYQDLRTVRNQIPTGANRTLAQLAVVVPQVVGQIYYCSNCVTEVICVSTGTAVNNLAGGSGRANQCK